MYMHRQKFVLQFFQQFFVWQNFNIIAFYCQILLKYYYVLYTNFNDL